MTTLAREIPDEGPPGPEGGRTGKGGGAAPRWLIGWGRFLFRHRNRVFPAVLLALVAAFPPARPPLWPGLGLGPWDWLDLVGVLLVGAGAALRVAVVGLVYIKRGGVDKAVYAQSLVTTGLFAHCRNPLYTGNLLIVSGLLLVHGHPVVVLAGGAFFVLSYAAMVANEEAYLGQRFPEEFPVYRSTVPRWSIRLRGLGATFACTPFSWQRVLVKEYGTVVVWAGSLALLLAWEAWMRRGGDGAPRWSFAVPLALFGLVLGGGVLVRHAKKAGRLRAPD